MKNNTDNYNFTTMLEEAQKKFDRQIRSLDVLRDHAKTILGVASILVSVFATFGTVKFLDKGSLHYLTIIIVIAVLYIWLMLESLNAALPKKFNAPIEATHEEYAKAFLNKSKEEIIKQQLANYLNVIHLNETIIEQKRRSSELITILMTAIVTCIIIASMIPLK